jgi:hypothetical protein
MTLRAPLLVLAVSLSCSAMAGEPFDGEFVAAGDMNFARYTAAAATLSDGSILVYGPSYDADQYTPASGFVEAGLIPGPRFAGHLVPLPDGGALLIGGSASDARTVRYDAAGRTWSWGPSMASARMYAQVAALTDGRVLVAGGYGANGTALATAEVYDPSTNAFTSTGSMPRARQGGVAERLADGRVLIAGGAGLSGYGDPCSMVYTPSSSTFSTGACFIAAQQGLYGPASATLHDGRVILWGGYVFTGSTTQRVSDDAEVYNPQTNSWTPYLVGSRADLTLTVLDDGSVLAVGGRNDWGVPIAQTQVFDPYTDTVHTGPALTMPRFGHTANALPGNRVLVAGGQVGGGQWSASAELYVGYTLFTGTFDP